MELFYLNEFHFDLFLFVCVGSNYTPSQYQHLVGEVKGFSVAAITFALCLINNGNAHRETPFPMK